jgi:hypothetical protein
MVANRGGRRVFFVWLYAVVAVLVLAAGRGSAAASSAVLDRFLDWLEDNGAQLEDVNINSSPSSGKPATASLRRGYAEGEVVFRLPRSLLFTPGVFASAGPHDIDATGDGLFGPDELLVLGLLSESAKGTKSFWAPWIATLPRVIPGQPFFFSAAELKGLSKTYAELEVNKHGHAAVRLFREKVANFTSKIGGDGGVGASAAAAAALISDEFDTLPRICWAFAVVWSRTIFLAGRDGTLHEFIAPLLDSFGSDDEDAYDSSGGGGGGAVTVAAATPPPSHGQGQLGLRFANSNTVLEAISSDNIAPGEPLLFSFAPDASNSQLLLRHGRPYLKNAYDFLPLSFTNPPDEALYEARAKLLAALKIPLNHKLRVGLLPPGLHECALVLTLDDDDARRIANTKSGMDLSVANTTRALHQLYSALTAMLARYPHSRQEDEEALAAKSSAGRPLSHNEQVVLTVRIGEKAVLEDSISRLEAKIKAGAPVETRGGAFDEAAVEVDVDVDVDVEEGLMAGVEVQSSAKCPCVEIVIVRADKLPKGDPKGAFGLFGSADPFVKVLLDGKELGRTEVVSGSQSPKWATGAGTISLRAVCMDHTRAASATLSVEVWDHDGSDDDEEFLGRADISTVRNLCARDFHGTSTAITVPLLSESDKRNKKSSLTFSFQPEVLVSGEK